MPCCLLAQHVSFGKPWERLTLRVVHAQLVRATGAEYLEAPVSGSKAPAEQGKLIFLAGGEQALFERAGPMLDAMGKAKFFLGEARAPCASLPPATPPSPTQGCKKCLVV